jgi:hypothetical protein
MLCQVIERKKGRPYNYRGCRYVEEMGKRKSQRAPKNNGAPATAVVTSTHSRLQWQDPSVPALYQQQETAQSVQAPNVNSLPLDKMFRVVTVLQWIMTVSMMLCQSREK